MAPHGQLGARHQQPPTVGLLVDESFISPPRNQPAPCPFVLKVIHNIMLIKVVHFCLYH